MTPFEGRDDWSKLWTADTSYLYSLDLVLKPENHKVTGYLHNPRRIPKWNYINDVNHEYHYESEDYDFTTNNFRLVQHFRKKATILPWLFCGILPTFYFCSEFLYQHYPDEEHWRLQRPPPLDYPDAQDTNNTVNYKNYHSKEGRRMLDMGLIVPLHFDIVDGKKVYRRFAGVNQPMDNI